MSERSRISARGRSAAKLTRRAAAPTSRAPKRTLQARRSDGAEPVGPIVKWVGGKTRLLDELTARVPEKFGRYFEPFAGGAALFFRLAPASAVLNDRNADLVATYRAVAGDVEAVIRRLEVHKKHHGEDHYYDLRDRWNDRGVSWSQVDRAAAFIYLNKTCYNGLWRVNRSGGFNVPMGRYIDPPICTPAALRAASRVLARAEIRNLDYRAAVADAKRGDLVYFDPPYDPVTPTANFTSYTGDGFGPDDQRALADLAKSLVARGVRVMLSNADTPRVRAWYAGLEIERVWCPRAINSNAARRGDVAEVVARG